MKRKSHVQLFEDLLKQFPPVDSEEAAVVQELKDWLETLTQDRETYGLIHYDFELDNLIWNEEGIHIIDFDDAVYSWYVADIAYALRDLFSEGKDIDLLNEFFLEFIRGYRIHSMLTPNQIEQIPAFYRFHNYLSYKKMERAIDLKVEEGHPPWLNGLIDKLKRYKKDLL